MGKLQIGRWGEQAVHWLTLHLSAPINAFGSLITDANSALVGGLSAIPTFACIIAASALAWGIAGWRLSLFAAVGLVLIWNQGLWPETIETFSLVVISVSLSLLIAVPLGILAAENRGLRMIVTPMLDFLQTMPRFVYLIPAVVILGIDVAPAVLATMTLAVVPPTRATIVGLAAVDAQFLETADSMGANWWQLLTRVKLPLALPAIMLGVNQCVMMALSMVIIASLIGAAGLGDEILKGIALLDAGRGIVGGLAVLILAILLDRLTKRSAEWFRRDRPSRAG